MPAPAGSKDSQANAALPFIPFYIFWPGLPKASATQMDLEAHVLLVDSKPNQVNH